MTAWTCFGGDVGDGERLLDAVRERGLAVSADTCSFTTLAADPVCDGARARYTSAADSARRDAVDDGGAAATDVHR